MFMTLRALSNESSAIWRSTVVGQGEYDHHQIQNLSFFRNLATEALELTP